MYVANFLQILFSELTSGAVSGGGPTTAVFCFFFNFATNNDTKNNTTPRIKMTIRITLSEMKSHKLPTTGGFDVTLMR